MKKFDWITAGAAALLCAAAATLWWVSCRDVEPPSAGPAPAEDVAAEDVAAEEPPAPQPVEALHTNAAPPRIAERRAPAERPRKGAIISGTVDPGSQNGDAGETPAEKEEREAVESFYAAIESWREPREGGPSPEDMEAFSKAFNRIPEERRIDEIHHANNLIPDENLLLLAGILFDKRQNKDVLDAIYSDVLNRSEEAKMPVIRQIFKDKSHPCWADAAWILDVTK